MLYSFTSNSLHIQFISPGETEQRGGAVKGEGRFGENDMGVTERKKDEQRWRGKSLNVNSLLIISKKYQNQECV